MSLSSLAPECNRQVQSSESVEIVKIEKAECPTPCEKSKPCESKCGDIYGWGWLGALFLWFVILMVFFWLIFYSLKPSFVLQNDSNQVDTGKVLLASILSAIILIAIIWLIKYAITHTYYT